MANPSSDYPTALHTKTDVSALANTALGSSTPKHTQCEGKQEEEIYAVQQKVGTGSSTPGTAGHVLKCTASGASAWGYLDHHSLAGLSDDDHPIYLNTARHDTTARHPHSVLASGGGTATKFLRDDMSWQTVSGGSGGTLTLRATVPDPVTTSLAAGNQADFTIAVPSGGTLVVRLCVDHTGSSPNWDLQFWEDSGRSTTLAWEAVNMGLSGTDCYDDRDCWFFFGTASYMYGRLKNNAGAGTITNFNLDLWTY